ncbi:MAG: hypothetical protein BRC58_05100 [Cyanobacteria bacterium QS_8_64_29]|jgi:hypothetical protein|nr:MAG: hypothetical protein BRC58_05100 [Cyanobacteria bacterium QS_8_64_29]
MFAQFVRFLREELGISQNAIELARRHCTATPSQLAMVLWQYGLIDPEQLDRIFDWLERA